MAVMSGELVQTAVVGVVVLVAAAVIVRRVFGFARRHPQPTCASCVSGDAAAATARPATDAPARPLVFVRAPRR